MLRCSVPSPVEDAFYAKVDLCSENIPGSTRLMHVSANPGCKNFISLDFWGEHTHYFLMPVDFSVITILLKHVKTWKRLLEPRLPLCTEPDIMQFLTLFLLCVVFFFYFSPKLA